MSCEFFRLDPVLIRRLGHSSLAAHWERFRQHAPQATCGRLTDQIVCVSSQSRDAFRKILESQRIH
jgi:hypothetical protein